MVFNGDIDAVISAFSYRCAASGQLIALLLAGLISRLKWTRRRSLLVDKLIEFSEGLKQWKGKNTEPTK